MLEEKDRHIFYHFSNKEIKEEDVKKYKYEQINCLKPNGLWISYENSGNGWFNWCVENEFKKDCLKYRHKITLKEDANILYVKTKKDIDDVFKHFGGKPEYPSLLDKLKKECLIDSNSFFNFIAIIDWKKLSSSYQGIIVLNYQSSKGDGMWYKAWDCDSGCIWDTSAIESVIAQK